MVGGQGCGGVVLGEGIMNSQIEFGRSYSIVDYLGLWYKRLRCMFRVGKYMIIGYLGSCPNEL